MNERRNCHNMIPTCPNLRVDSVATSAFQIRALVRFSFPLRPSRNSLVCMTGKGVGWGNVMHEVVLNAYVAYLSKRMYVLAPFSLIFTATFPSTSYAFENYTWDKGESDFSNYKGKPIPARVPLTALISGMLPLLSQKYAPAP